MMKRQRQAGFTLIELVLVITLIGILAGAGAIAFAPALDTWSLVSSRAEAVNTSQYALDRMISEIGVIKNAQSVITAGAGELQFTDLDDNNIHYQLTGDLLMRNDDVLSRGIQGLAFVYTDINNAPIANPIISPVTTDIWRIGVQITDQVGNQTITIASDIHPRNLPRPPWAL